MNPSLTVNNIYSIRICSGEQKVWRYLGVGEGGRVWWCDSSTGIVFNEESILYAWEVVGEFLPNSKGMGVQKSGY